MEKTRAGAPTRRTMFIPLITALLPVPLIYLIYFRHFFRHYRQESITPEYTRHFESLLCGIALALLIILLAPFINSMLPVRSILTDAFVKAALVEKLGAVITLYLIIGTGSPMRPLDCVICGVLVGMGFSMVENVFYAASYGPSVILVRILFSVPLHLTTCALIGYFLGLRILSDSGFNRMLNLVRAAVIPFALHGLFDVLLLNGGPHSYCIGPLIVFTVGALELLIARAKMIPERAQLDGMGLRLEDWQVLFRQPRYERWILNSMGTPTGSEARLFKSQGGAGLWALTALFLTAAVILFPFRNELFSLLGLEMASEERVLIVSIYPASIGFILMMVGTVNPSFFKYSAMRIPIIFDAVLRRDDTEENLVTFDITTANCFLRTFEPFPSEGASTLYFETQRFRSPEIPVSLIWENHLPQNGPTGSIVGLIAPGAAFYAFLARYYLYRLRKGFIFNLKLPGFEGIRRLFMRPATVMQKEVSYQPGATVFRQGDEVNTFYFIKKGRVNFYRELESGERVFLESMEQGQIFNELALLGDTKRTVTVVCETRCILAQASADNLEALIKNNPDFALALAQKLAHRVDQSQTALSESMDYMGKLLRVRSWKARNALLLVLGMLGQKRVDSTYVVELDPDFLNGDIPAIADDLLRYINQALESEESDENTDDDIDSDTVSTIEEYLGEFNLELRIKENGR
ncbi:MAG: cyclic nucleotide-binding domain-containing protein [Spirochaetota bacterium]|jgi:CRP-like cAMP-binding protein/RsiW-degrading membrane proteinase PrsW (M82 family)